jgi:acyl-CoA hydrolase
MEGTSAASAASKVREGDEVVVDTSRPTAILEALLEHQIDDVVVTAFGFPYADSSVLRSLATREGVEVRLSMVPGDLREAISDGAVSYVPRTVYQAARQPALDPDRRTVGIVQTPDRQDEESHRLGCLSALGRKLLTTADLSLVETNPQLPGELDCEVVPTNDVDYVVESEGRLPRLPSREIAGAEEIASNLVSLVPQEPTIQLGVGSIMEAVGEQLAEDGPVSLWTGLLGESARPLVEGDACTSVTACVAIGQDSSFYNWVEGVDEVQFVGGDVSHAPEHLAAQSPFVAINSALQIDLRGQINAETIRSRQIGGVGGQSAFMTAARNDPEGVAIIAMPARTGRGLPKLVGRLPESEVVTTPRYAVDAVVTEHGVARLAGCSVEERASRLISVAHPEDRVGLETTAREHGLLG